MRIKAALMVIPWLAGILLTAAWVQLSPQIRERASSEIDVLDPPCARVVINEVAWGGTRADPTDEWIELANTTPLTIDLAGWRITAADGSPDLTLVGHIAPYGFYLIERTADTTVADIPGDLVCTFNTGLENAGEQLTLRDSLGHIVDTVNAGGTTWPNSAGLVFPFPSMERVTPASPDIAANWVSNDGTVVHGTDAGGNPIPGTPRKPNAAYYPHHNRSVDLTVAVNGPLSATPGSQVPYVLLLRNTGGATATSTLLTITLPSVLDFVGHTSAYSHSLSDQHVVWVVGDLAPEASAHITLSTQLDAGSTTPFVVSLHATSSITELNPCDNAASWSTQPANEPAISIALRGPTILTHTGTFSYHMTVTNGGTAPLASVHLVDILPDDVRYMHQVSPFPVNHTPPTLTWELGPMPAQTTHTFTIAVQLTVPLSAVDLLTNTVLVNAVGPDGLILGERTAWVTKVGASRVVIAALLYDGYQDNDADEAINLTNIGTAEERLDGWSLCKATSGDLDCVSLPTLTLAAGNGVWLARDAEAFGASFGFSPDIVLPQWCQFANTGDAIVLRAPGNRYIDTLVYKSGNTNVPGWSGAPVLPYRNQIASETGQVLSRRLDEETGLPASDTDTALDWMQDTSDPVLGRRVAYPGWDYTTLFRPLEVTETATITAGIAPDSAFEVISQTLMRAERTISIEVYSLRHLEIGRLLAAKARAGVRVTVLLEGTPVGVAVTSPEWQTQLYVCQELEKAGGACWFMAHQTADHVYNRYAYIHAKLAIVDDTWVAVGTQNFTPSGLPADDKSNGTTGTRGVVLVTDAPSVVRRAATIFDLDLDPANHGDLVRWNTHYPDRYGEPIPDMVELEPQDGISYTVQFSRPLSISGTFSFELFTAPEAALRHSDALLGLVQRAGSGDRVYVEQLYEYAAWGPDIDADPNLRLQAYIDAARRGAHVRILLNGRSFATGDPHPPEENALTVQTVNSLAARENLDLRASTGAPTGDAIHNKMVLVELSRDDATYVHIGSLNGSESASKLNREIALQVQSPQLYAYLRRLFTYDWSVSHPTYLPLLAHQYASPPRITHILLSEVAYATSGSAYEWVELYNPTAQTIDLSSYKLGDAESPAAWEPMFQFPPGASMAPGAVIIVAVNANKVPGADFEFYETDPAVPNMQPYTGWGTTAYPFALRDLGDQVILLDAGNEVVDVVVWGDRTFPGIVPHPGVAVSGASLERHPANRDTDDCTVDFRERHPPTPGIIEE